MTGADIQIENGEYTRIHNRILEALYQLDLSGVELRLLLYLFRETYGWQRKEKQVSYNEFADALHVSRRGVKKYLDRLQEQNIIQSRSNGQREARTWWFNKYVEKWQQDGEQLLHSNEEPMEQSFNSPMEQSFNSPMEQSDNSLLNNRSTELWNNRSTNIKKEKEREKKGEMPPGLGGPRKPSPRQQPYIELNAQLPINERKPLVDAIASMMGKSALIEADDSSPLLLEIHEAAVVLHKMGVRLEHLRSWWKPWQADWRCKGAKVSQFKEFASEQLEQNGIRTSPEHAPVITGPAIGDNPWRD